MAEEETKEKGNQFIEDLKDTAKNRLSNPVLFSYLFSWVVCNWTFISFMFFSNKTIEYKLVFYGKYIDFCGWLYPIIGVLIYLIGLNYIDDLFNKFSIHGYQKRLNSWKERINLKTGAEVEIAKKKIALQQEQIQADQLDVLIKERDRLKHESQKKDDEIKELNARLQKSEHRFIDNVTDSFNSRQNSTTGNSSMDANNALVILEKMGLVETFYYYAEGDLSNSIAFSADQSKKEGVSLFKALGLVADSETIFPTLTVIGNTVLALIKANRFKR